MADDNRAITGYVLLAVGGLLILLAIILVIVVIHKRRKLKKRAHTPDTFKVVYNVPMANGMTTKMAASDVFDGKSVHTIPRSEPGYAYVQPAPVAPVPVLQLPPSPPPLAPEPVVIRAPSVMAAASTLPRAASVDQLSYVTMPRAGYKHIYPSGNTSRLIIPISKKKAKKLRKQNAPKPLYIPMYSSNAAPRAQSLVSAPAYATSVRSMTSGPTRNLTAEQRNKYYLYGSTPNLHANTFTQPVLMYDSNKRHFQADEITAGRNDHVQHWLHHEHPTTVQVEHMDIGRPVSHASSAPSDLDARQDDFTSQSLHLRWSPSMRRRLAEMDRREAIARSERLSSSDVPPDSPKRYQPLQQHYRELTETF